MAWDGSRARAGRVVTRRRNSAGCEELVWAVWKTGTEEGKGRWCAEESRVLWILPSWTRKQVKGTIEEGQTSGAWLLSRETRIRDGATVLRIRTPARAQLDAALARPSTEEEVNRHHVTACQCRLMYERKRPWRALTRESWPIPQRRRIGQLAPAAPQDVVLSEDVAGQAEEWTPDEADYEC